MQETWYVLEDGRTVDPSDVAPDDSGVLVHISGVPVAMRSPGVPLSRGVDAARARAEAAAAAKVKADADGKGKAEVDAKVKGETDAKGKGKAMKPEEQGGNYKTRETKAD
jgi:hypothetical protein